MDKAFAVIEHLLVDFSLRRWLSAIVLLALLSLAAIAFERQTGYFKLWRIEKEIDLLDSLRELDSKGVSDSPDLAEARKELGTQLQATIKANTASSIPSLTIEQTWWIKGGVAFIPWLLLLIRTVIGVLRGQQRALAALLPTIVFGGISFIIAAMLPTYGWPWTNLVLYPAALFVLVLLIIASTVEYEEGGESNT